MIGARPSGLHGDRVPRRGDERRQLVFVAAHGRADRIRGARERPASDRLDLVRSCDSRSACRSARGDVARDPVRPAAWIPRSPIELGPIASDAGRARDARGLSAAPSVHRVHPGRPVRVRPACRAADPRRPAAILDPPADPPKGWLRLGAGFGLPALWLAVCLVVIPIGVYVVSYIPWARSRNHQIVEGWPAGHTGQTLLERTGKMYEYHNNLSSPHPASSPWWAWSLDLKPVWFYEEGFAGRTSASIYDAGNLVAWWLAIPAMGFVAWQAFKRRSPALALITIAFAVQWISWARIDRAAFQYHYYTALPFLFLALAYFLAELWHGPSRRTWLLARLSAGAAILLPFTMCLVHRPLCALARVTEVNEGSQACPTLIPDVTVTPRAVAMAVVIGLGVLLLLRELLTVDDDGLPRNPGPLAEFGLGGRLTTAAVIAAGTLDCVRPRLDAAQGRRRDPAHGHSGRADRRGRGPRARASGGVRRDGARCPPIRRGCARRDGLLVRPLVPEHRRAAVAVEAIHNAYQGFLPTYLYPFQFWVRERSARDARRCSTSGRRSCCCPWCSHRGRRLRRTAPGRGGSALAERKRDQLATETVLGDDRGHAGRGWDLGVEALRQAALRGESADHEAVVVVDLRGHALPAELLRPLAARTRHLLAALVVGQEPRERSGERPSGRPAGRAAPRDRGGRRPCSRGCRCTRSPCPRPSPRAGRSRTISAGGRRAVHVGGLEQRVALVVVDAAEELDAAELARRQVAPGLLVLGAATDDEEPALAAGLAQDPVRLEQVEEALARLEPADEQDVLGAVLPAGDRDRPLEPADVDAVGDDLVVAREEAVDEVPRGSGDGDPAMDTLDGRAQEPGADLVRRARSRRTRGRSPRSRCSTARRTTSDRNGTNGSWKWRTSNCSRSRTARTWEQEPRRDGDRADRAVGGHAEAPPDPDDVALRGALEAVAAGTIRTSWPRRRRFS